ncbi:MAG: hypothetical protein ISS90_02025 [Candidatus Omnitrophica bacterium]|nr:hypothetical protein [Candidatus Omnitrophota bacterium]
MPKQLTRYRKNALFCALLALIFLCGCGYTTRSAVRSKDPSICVNNFVNKINVTQETTNRKAYYAYRPGMESDITTEIINRFLFDGDYEIKDANNAHYLLKGELVDFKREPLRYDTNDNVTEYRISVVINMELRDRETGTLLWKENDFAGESTYRTQGQYAKPESAAAGEAIKDLADRVVERTVENW